jgi:hypothetical protein
MAKNYYAQAISPHMSETVHGYLICEDVPICRSGFQEYLGSELVGMPGYESSWELDPNGHYNVYRPKNEVLDPLTIKSFEGCTVVDEHPDSSVVHIDNDQELSCGHIEKVRRGPDHGGEVTLIGDLHIKNPELKKKVMEDGVRDISCGYLLKLVRLPDKTLEMHSIRGNHVAVVEKGRAGSRIAIKDSAPPEIKKRKVTSMNMLETIFGRGVKAYAADATDDDLAILGRSMFSKAPEPKQANDSSTLAVDKKEEEKPAMDAHRAAAHAALDRCMDAMKDAKKMGCDAFGKPTGIAGLKKALDSYFATDAEDKKEDKEEDKPTEDSKVEELKEEKAAEDKAEEHQEEKTAAEEHEEMNDEEVAEDAEGTDKINDLGKNVLGALDSVRSFMKVSKPLVAIIANKPISKRSQAEKVMLDSYNQSVRALNESGGKSYKMFSKIRVPDNIPALATDKAVVVEDCSRFYEGVPYAIGKRRHQEYLDKKESK